MRTSKSSLVRIDKALVHCFSLFTEGSSACFLAKIIGGYMRKGWRNFFNLRIWRNVLVFKAIQNRKDSGQCFDYDLCAGLSER